MVYNREEGSEEVIWLNSSSRDYIQENWSFVGTLIIMPRGTTDDDMLRVEEAIVPPGAVIDKDGELIEEESEGDFVGDSEMDDEFSRVA